MRRRELSLPGLMLGFEKELGLANDNSFPYYNVVKLENGYRVEIAVPGWSKEEVEVFIEKNILRIEGMKQKIAYKADQYVHKGLTSKTFKKAFTVAEHLELAKAILTKGLLCIDFKEREVPSNTKKVEVVEQLDIDEELEADMDAAEAKVRSRM